MTAQFRSPLLALAFVFASMPAWATTIEAPGVPNFRQVNDHIYRGAQPTDHGWKSLADLGIKTVIDLRRDGEEGGHSIAAEARAVEANGMRFVSIPMNGLVAPSDEQISRILALFDSGEPTFVHCRRGKDRTGTAIACYRIAHEQWTNQKAMDEARSLGLHWIEIGMKRYIMAFRARAPFHTAGVETKTAAAGQ
jgi:tyrosine-protein phosphatase SIW14